MGLSVVSGGDGGEERRGGRGQQTMTSESYPSEESQVSSHQLLRATVRARAHHASFAPRVFNPASSVGPTDGGTDGRTDGRTNGGNRPWRSKGVRENDHNVPLFPPSFIPSFFPVRVRPPSVADPRLGSSSALPPSLPPSRRVVHHVSEGVPDANELQLALPSASVDHSIHRWPRPSSSLSSVLTLEFVD